MARGRPARAAPAGAGRRPAAGIGCRSPGPLSRARVREQRDGTLRGQHTSGRHASEAARFRGGTFPGRHTSRKAHPSYSASRLIRYSVTERKVSPARSRVEGKAGWLGLSG